MILKYIKKLFVHIASADAAIFKFEDDLKIQTIGRESFNGASFEKISNSIRSNDN